MPALFHLNEPLDLSHQYAPPVAQNYSTCELEDLDASMALQTFLASGFLPTQKDDKGAARRGYSMRATEAFACDDFRMYEYKVRRCMRGRSHDWTDCPFTHPGEKARRRDPRKFHYSGAPCPEFRKGSCRRGDACEFAHGVFECWLHPARYRTQACKDGQGCMRRVCFFAHTLQQLRHVGVPVEDSLEERDFMVDAYTHELGLALCDGSSVMVSEGDSPFDVGFMEGLASQNVYADVSNLCEVLSMLALPSQNAVSSPSEAFSTMECPSNNSVGLPSPMFSMDVSGIAQRPSNAFPVMGMAATLNSQPYTPYLGGLSYPKSHDTLHSSYLDGSPLQKAAALNLFLMSGGYEGRGESLLSVSAEEFSDMVQYGGYGGDAATRQGYVDVDGLGYGEHEENEVAQKTQFAALGKEKYEFSNYNGSGSYGLPSPVSTLAGPLCSSPLSSPPLSPLSTSSNEATNGFFMRGRNNLLRDNASWKGDVFIKNMHHMEEIGIQPTFAEHVHHHSQLSACGNVKKLVPLHLRSPSATQCTSGQYKRSPLCDDQSSDNTDKCNFLQRDGQYSNCGEFRGESTAENAMPDLGWVNELVM